jgi:hypothetical protein
MEGRNSFFLLDEFELLGLFGLFGEFWLLGVFELLGMLAYRQGVLILFGLLHGGRQLLLFEKSSR